MALVAAITGLTLYIVAGKLSEQIGKTPSLTFNQDVFPAGYEIRTSSGNPIAGSGSLKQVPEVQQAVEEQTEEYLVAVTPEELPGLQEIEAEENAGNDMTDLRLTIAALPYIEDKEPAGKYDIRASRQDNYSGFSDRWSLGAAMMPSYFSKFYTGKDESGKEYIGNESTTFSYSGGLSFSFEISERISVMSGFLYSSIGQRIDGISSFSGFVGFSDTKSSGDFMVRTSAGSINSTNKDIYLLDVSGRSRVITRYNLDVFDPVKADLSYLSNSLMQNMNYLTIPLLMKYKLVDRKVDINMLGGLSYGILINNSSYITSGGVKYIIGKTEGLSPVTFSSEVGMGVEYKLSEKLYFNIEPLLRYFITPIGGNPGTNIHPYSFGIFSGVFYNF